MTAVHAVLLVPSEAMREKLLADGPCGSRPPMVYRERTRSGRWRPFEDYSKPWTTRSEKHWMRALVLAWERKVVGEGLDRAARRGAWNDTPRRVRALLKGDYCAAYIVPPSMGTEVLIDGAGRVHTREELAIAAGQQRAPSEPAP